MSLAVIILIVTILAAAGFVQGYTGFGSALLALPLLAFFIDIRIAVSLVALMGMLIGAIHFVSNRNRLPLKSIRALLITAALGAPLGTLLLKTLPAQPIKLTLAVMLMGYSILAMRGIRLKFLAHRVYGYVCGFASGLLGASTGLSGPPVILYASVQDWPALHKKTSITLFLFITSVLTVILHGVSGLLVAEVQLYFLLAALPLIAATRIGIRLFNASGSLVQERGLAISMFLLGAILLVQSMFEATQSA